MVAVDATVEVVFLVVFADVIHRHVVLLVNDTKVVIYVQTSKLYLNKVQRLGGLYSGSQLSVTISYPVLLGAIWHGRNPVAIPFVVVEVELSATDKDMDIRDAVQAFSCGRGIPPCGSYFDVSIAPVASDCVVVQVKGCSVGVTVSDSLRLAVYERSDDFFSNLSHNLIVLVS
jgi:hypothetical protein